MTDRKSVIQIDVQDAAWKRFAKSFAKFKVDTKEVAESIEAVTDGADRVAATKKRIVEQDAKIVAMTKEQRANMEAQARAEKAAYEHDRKKYALQTKAKEDARRERADSIKGLRDSAKWTADIARNVASTAYNAAKWVAFSAVASGFGLGGLAANASTVRRTAQGLGLNAGELRAANVNFGRYINPEGALSNIADAETDMGKRWVLQNSLGINTQGRSSGEILAQALPRLVDAFRAGGGTLQGAQARGLTEIVSIEDLRRLSSLTREELSKTIEAYRKDRESLNEGDSTGRAWQDFLVSLHRAGNQIEVSLLRALTRLTPYLTQFANGIAKAIDTFASNGGLQAWIEKVGAALQKLGAYLGSKEFVQDVESFMRAIHAMAQFVGKMFPDSTPDAWTKNNVIENPAGTTTNEPVGKWAATWHVYRDFARSMFGGAPLSERNHNPGNLRVPGSKTEFQSFSNDNDGLRAMARQLELYESRDKLTTLRGIISRYAPGSENDTAAYIAAVSQRTGLGADQQLTPGDRAQLANIIAAMTKQENGRSNFTAAGVKVVIENQTGGSAQATVAALAH